MRYRFINFPEYMPMVVYDRAIRKVVDTLSQVEGVLSIYQIGSISDPGISDVDLIAVFKEGIECTVDPLKRLEKKERYLFTHSVFGICERHFWEIQEYSYYHNYKHLWGKKIDLSSIQLDCREKSGLKRQIALEFLVSNYISRTIEKTYGIISVRNVLLSTKAVLYDLDFLSIKKGSLLDLVRLLVKWRKEWFNMKFTYEDFCHWFLSFYEELVNTLESELMNNNFYLPANIINYGKHCKIIKNEKLNSRHIGCLMPRTFARLGKKYFRLNNKLGHFKFEIPFSTATGSKLIRNRFAFFEEMKNYNDQYLTKFNPLGGNFSNKEFLIGNDDR